jgi:RNA polymerase sigma-70 factor (ECF subfamily)
VTDGDASIDGVTGIAIGRLEPRNGTRQEIVIDPATGQVIGAREVQVVAGDGPPAGTVISQVRVTRTLVDGVPADVKRTAQRFECTVDVGGATVCQAG